ncbi:MAG: Hsp33 family molecular chaperone HslO [Bacillota bacterium]
MSSRPGNGKATYRDYLIRAVEKEGRFRILAARTTDTVDEARQRHQTSPVVTAALGRVLTAAALLGATLKGEDTITIRVVGNGPMGGIIADADAMGNVRGYAHEARVDLPGVEGKLPVGQAVGSEGFLYVTKDLGLKEPYTGSVPLVSGEIAEDLARYFSVSEQTASAVNLGVLVETDLSVRAAGGLIVQVLPEGREDGDLVNALESNVMMIGPVSRAIEGGMSPEGLIKLAATGFDVEFFDPQPVSFGCRCDRERVERALISLGREELAEMIADGEPVEMTCHFCQEKYIFSPDQVKEIAAKGAAGRVISREIAEQ